MPVDWKKLVIAVVLCELAGIMGSLFTFSSIDSWYAALSKPFFSPPNWVFGPVWTILYFLMGVSLYLVWTNKNPVARSAYAAFGIQLGLNALWSAAFFGLQSPFLGFIVIALLWLAILATIKLFWRYSQNAALLLVPYFLWVSFAAALNFAVWQLN